MNQLLSTGKYDLQLDENGKYVLQPKGRTGYYTQVQLTMFCMGKKMCKLVWTEGKGVVADFNYDRDFVSEIMLRMRKFNF